MRWIALVGVLVCMNGCKPSQYLQKSTIHLSTPIFHVDRIMFDGMESVEILPVAQGATVFYSINGSKHKKYQSPILVNESAKISACAKGGSFIPSDTSFIEVLKLPKSKLNSITSKRALHEKYGVGGLDLLIDFEKGEADFNNGWLGYLGDTVAFDLAFETKEVSSATISSLSNSSAWIFSPSQIKIYNNGGIIYTHELSAEKEATKTTNIFTKIKFPAVKTDRLTVEIIAPKEIPSWHPGTGSKPWIFIDEIIIY